MIQEGIERRPSEPRVEKEDDFTVFEQLLTRV
jgi:hypothetical protein